MDYVVAFNPQRWGAVREALRGFNSVATFIAHPSTGLDKRIVAYPEMGRVFVSIPGALDKLKSIPGVIVRKGTNIPDT